MKELFEMLKAFLRYRVYLKLYIDQYVYRTQSYRIRRNVKKLKHKDVINIVFLSMSVAMWKYQHLYDLLEKDSRFRLYIFLSPAIAQSPNYRIKELQGMREYFSKRQMPFIDYELEKGKPIVDIETIVDPDILIYPQPYNEAIENTHCFLKYFNKLIAYVPYGFIARQEDNFDYNLRFNNLAWKLYYPTRDGLDLARQHAKNRGENVVVVGYSGIDDYLLPLEKDPWKQKDRRIKRVVWAPHFSITNGVGFSQISNFLNMADFMTSLAEEYYDRITIAFKPHPRLYSELCKYEEWGEEKTKEYYSFWEKNPSTQLEIGEYVNLFKGSDALIHDCGTFTLDYLYVGKPVLYDHPDIEAAKATANEIGKKAYDMHYRVHSNYDIKRFIDDVVLRENDYMKEQRDEFYNEYLLPPNGKSVAQNIYDDLILSLRLDRRAC